MVLGVSEEHLVAAAGDAGLVVGQPVELDSLSALLQALRARTGVDYGLDVHILQYGSERYGITVNVAAAENGAPTLKLALFALDGEGHYVPPLP